MKLDKMMKIEMAIFVLIFLVVMVITLSVLFRIDSNKKSKNEEIVNGSLLDLSLDRNDFKVV